MCLSISCSTHLSKSTRTYFSKSGNSPITDCPRVTNDLEQPNSRRKSVWSISSHAQSGRFRMAQKKASTDECPTTEVLRYLDPPTRGHLHAMPSSIHVVTSVRSRRPREPSWIFRSSRRYCGIDQGLAHTCHLKHL